MSYKRKYSKKSQLSDDQLSPDFDLDKHLGNLISFQNERNKRAESVSAKFLAFKLPNKKILPIQEAGAYDFKNNSIEKVECNYHLYMS